MEDLLKKATGGLEGVALDIVNASSGILKKKLTEAFAIERLKIFRENIERIGFVKTILNPDSIKKLDDIYFGKTVAYDSCHFDFFSQFRRPHVLIEGGPGQGKSLFLSISEHSEQPFRYDPNTYFRCFSSKLSPFLHICNLLDCFVLWI